MSSVIVRLFPNKRMGAMPSAAESSEPPSTDDLPKRRFVCRGLFSLVGILAFWIITDAVGYMGVFTCIHTGYGSSSSLIDVVRDGVVIATGVPGSSWIDNLDVKGGATYVYQVCDASSGACSNTVIVVF
jgi:hypothetical protein